MINFILVLLVAGGFGLAAVLWGRLAGERLLAVALGLAAGVSLFSALAFATAQITADTTTAGALALTIMAGATVVMGLKGRLIAVWKELPFDQGGAVFAAVAAIAFGLCARQSLVQDANGWGTGIISSYGDVGLHAALTTALAAAPHFPPENPVFAGMPLAYPFLPDFFSSVIHTPALTLAANFNVTAGVFGALVFALIYLFTREITGKRAAGGVAAALFLFGGSTLGFTKFFTDLAAAPGLTALAQHWPSADYTGSGGDPNGFHFINPAFCLLLSQRALLFGIPQALALLLMQIHAVKQATTRWPAWLLIGAVAGLLPLFHPHTVLALLPAEALLIVLSFWPNLLVKAPASPTPVDRRRLVTGWFVFAISALVIGAPGLWFYATVGAVANQHLTTHFWWQADSLSPLVYWFKNTGLLLPLTIAGLFLPAPRLTKALALAGLAVFAAANTWQFARWTWDNYKLFVYWLLLCLPMVSWILARLTERGIFGFVAVAAVVAFQSFSGLLDYLKVVTPLGSSYGEWDREGILFADAVRTQLPPGIHVVNNPVHNSPVFLAGAFSYLGYPAHAWSHGFETTAREHALRDFYQGKLETLPEQQPQYVLIGPGEEAAFAPIKVRPTWREVLRQGPYILFDMSAR